MTSIKTKGLVLMVGVAACGRDSAVGSRLVRHDSAGVEIVESTAPRWREGAAWIVDSEPFLDLATSGTGPEHEFYRVRDAIRLRDGSIAVADYGSAEIRRFSPSGGFLQRYGREGEGPGEFRRLTSVDQIRGDSLLAFDYWLGRVTIFGLDGSGSRTFEVRESNTRVQHIAPLSDGTLVGVERVLDQSAFYGLYRTPYVILTFGLAGETGDTIARIPGYQGYHFDRGDARPLFGKDGHMAVYGSRIYLGSADRMEVMVHAATGELETVMRVPGYDLRLSAEELRAERAAATPGPEAPAFIREVAASLPDPETRPAYSMLLVDADGFVWAPEYRGRGEGDRPTDCTIFDPHGEWLGSVRLPPRFSPFEIGTDYVLGVRTDELAVEHVQLLRLERTGLGGSAS